jgi:hypothetical protein
VYQRERAQILSVQIQQIECDINALALSENQISKGGTAGFVEATNLAVEYSAFDAEVFGDPGCKLGEAVECVAVS